MGLTNTARDAIATAVATGTLDITAFNNANSRIGVGTSTVAFATSQTNLQATGAGNAVRVAMDATYPTDSGAAVLTYRSTFATNQANFAWQEWGVFNGAGTGDPPTGADMLNRKVESLGTKTSAQTWQITGTLTFTAA